jgi:hypothetical protein
MPSKDNPLENDRPGYRTDSRTLFLEREGMLEARKNFFAAYVDATRVQSDVPFEPTARAIWDIAWAAAIAAFSFIQEGRIKPR